MNHAKRSQQPSQKEPASNKIMIAALTKKLRPPTMFLGTAESLFYQLCKLRFRPVEMMVNFAPETTLK